MSTVKVNVIRSKLIVRLKRSSRKHMSNMKALCPRVERGLQFFIFFIKVGQRPKSMSSGQNCWYMCGKVLSPAIHMSNIKVLSQRVERKLKVFFFYKSRSKVKVKVIRSKLLVCATTSCNNYVWESLCNEIMASFKLFIKIGLRLKSRSSSQNCWYVWKGIVTSNTYVKYQSPKSKRRKRIEIL